MRKQRLLAVAISAFIGVASAAPAMAAPLSGLEGLGKPVEDEALAGMRGKFVAPSGVAYFGIVMSSSWQGSDGITTAATLLFSLDFAHGGSSNPVPQLMVSWSRECAACGDDSMDVDSFGPSANGGYVALSGNGVSIPVGGLDTATGVVQSQQIAGSDNQSRNLMNIQIVPSGSMHADTTGMTPLVGGQTQQFANGDTLQFTGSGQQLGLSISGRNGAVQQSVQGSLGQLAQHVLISGNDIIANNNMSLMVGLDPVANSQRLSMQNALMSMKGLGF
jgi:hypothetical protein